MAVEAGRLTQAYMKIKSFLAFLVLISIVVTGCAGNRFAAVAGWAGPVVSEDLVYVGSRSGRVLALDVNTGAQRWIFPTEGSDPLGGLYGTPAVDDGRLFVGTYDGRLYALDAADGTLLWQFLVSETQNASIVGGPTVADGLVLFGSSDYCVRALRVADGTQAWLLPFCAENKVWSTPTVVGDKVYIGSLDHRVYALSLRDGTQQWAFEAKGAIVSSPLVVDGKVFVGSFDRSFYVLDASSGRELQSFEGDGWFWASPITDGKRVYAATMGGKLYALDTGRNSVWRELPVTGLENPVVSTPVLVDGNIAIASDGGFLFTLSPDTGQLLATKFNIKDEARAPLGAGNGVVYANVKGESVWAVRVGAGQKMMWRWCDTPTGECKD